MAIPPVNTPPDYVRSPRSKLLPPGNRNKPASGWGFWALGALVVLGLAWWGW